MIRGHSPRLHCHRYRADRRDIMICKNKNLPEAINLLTDELREWREQWMTHLDMKKELQEMEGRLVKAIQQAKQISVEDQRSLDGLTRRSERIVKKLEAVAKQTP